MNIWKDLSGQAGYPIVSFIEAVMKHPPPVFWHLRLLSDFEFDSSVRDLESRGVEARRRRDSQTLELDFRERVPPGGFIEFLARAVRGEDDRSLEFREDRPLSGVPLEGRTAVPASPEVTDRETFLPVVGPGGRVILFETSQGFPADVTVRRRVQWSHGAWRPPGELTARLQCECPGGSLSGLHIQGAFGYFELSKYELQGLMRPAFVFSVTQPQDVEGQWPGWQITVVEPATTSTRFDLAEGLGAWTD